MSLEKRWIRFAGLARIRLSRGVDVASKIEPSSN
jgi:hypothetical protein